MLRHAFLFALIVPIAAPLGLGIIANNAPAAPVAAVGTSLADAANGHYGVEAELSALPASVRQALSLNDVVLEQMSYLPTLDLSQQPGREERCLAQAVYFEARSEPLEGQLAVAQVVLNRVASKRYPDSICKVVFQNEHQRFRCQFSFACDGLPDNPYNMSAWRLSRAVAKVALEGGWRDMAHRATHYHAVYVEPYWRSHMEQTAQFGLHIFYRDHS